MEFPENLRYTQEHEWIRLESDGNTATIGITDFAQQELGDVVYVELESVGTQLNAGDTFGTVEAVKTVSELFMPIGGTIKAHNEELDGNPELVNEEPYGRGWMIQVTLDDVSSLDGLLSSEAYAAHVS